MKQLYKISNSKFKGIFISLNYTMDVTKEELSKTVVLASILSKSSSNYQNQTEIEKHLFKLYGTSFDVNVQKIGDLYDLEFKINFVNKKFLPSNKDIFKDCLNFLNEMIYNPNIKNGVFDNTIVEREKQVIIDRVNQRKDNKITYGISRAEELMNPDKVSGYYLFGEEEIIKNITTQDLVNMYNKVINDSCITTIVSGNLDGYENIDEMFDNIFSNKLNTKYKYNDLIVNKKEENISNNIREVEEKQDTNQSVITYGIKIDNVKDDDFYKINMYNSILGVTPTSKLFQNFREKESLAYMVRSIYYRFKDMIIIFAGIQKKDYEKAKICIEEQLRQILDNEITEEEFYAAKEGLISDLTEWEDNKIAIAKMFFSNLFGFKNDKVTINEMIKKMSNVTLEDVLDVAKRIRIEQIYFLGGEVNA